MSLLRPERRQWIPEPFVPPFPGAEVGSRNSSPTMTGAMQASAVWACVRLIASNVSMMPLQSFTLRNNVRVPIDMPKLFVSPDAGTTTLDWVYMLMASLLLRGNAYGKVAQRDAGGFPTQITLLNPDDVTPRKSADGTSLQYYYKSSTIPIPDQDLFHARAYRIPGLDVGLSPIQYGALSINRDNAIQRFSLGYFQDAPHPSSVLTSDLPVSAEHARTIKERLISSINGREPLILGAGLKFSPLSVSPEESQFLATQRYGAAEIARYYGVPPQKIAAAEVGSSMTYATVESSNMDLLIGTIQWWISNLEATFAPLLPGKQHVRFDPSVLLRTDFETRMKSTAIGIASKQLLPDEARAMGDMPPLTDEQKALLDLVPMDVGPTGTPKALPGVNKIAAATDPNLAAETEGAS